MQAEHHGFRTVARGKEQGETRTGTRQKRIRRSRAVEAEQGGGKIDAVAVAWALDLTPDLIRAGLKNYGQPAAPTKPQVARKKA